VIALVARLFDDKAAGQGLADATFAADELL